MGKKVRSLTFYAGMLALFGVLMYGIIKMSDRFDDDSLARPIVENVDGLLARGYSIFSNGLGDSIRTPVAMLLLQVITILIVARLCGWLFMKMRQPSVIGEIMAGIILGPSALAQFFPDVSAFLFSPDSLSNIMILRQIGLILFMFVIGMELDISAVRKRVNETILISHAGIIVPFFCGMLIAYWTYPRYASGTTSFLSYSLFVGIAMSITAFPVLARIIQEKGLTKSHLGALSLVSAANGDITAWCLLAAVIAIAQSGTFVGALYTILFAVLFLLVMFFVIRPFLKVIGNLYKNDEVITKTIVALMLLILIISSYITEILGIHALFGAFMAGVIMPANPKFRKIMTEKVEDVSLSIFLPLFFVSTGLKTQIGLISAPEEWFICLIIILFAVIGKVIGTVGAARVVGESWKDSWSLGALMNTRGLMELIVLTIGYEMQILPPAIFVMLVLMTLATTIITGPLLNFIDFCYRKKEKVRVKTDEGSGKFRLLLSFGRSDSGQLLLNVANQVFSKGEKPLDITALHLTVGTDINPIFMENFEKESFKPILEEARSLQIDVRTRYDLTNDVGPEIVKIVNDERYDFLLVGGGISLSSHPEDVEATRRSELYHKKYFSKIGASQSWFYPGDLVKDKTRFFIETTQTSVGIFVDRGFGKADKAVVILEKASDIFLLKYALNLMRLNDAAICLHELGEGVDKDRRAAAQRREFLSAYNDVFFIRAPQLSTDILAENNFMLISYSAWTNIFESEKDALQWMPSTLIINEKERSPRV